MAAATTTGGQDYDRLKELKQFDDSKVGVKGLVDSGLTSIPRFFLHPPETLPLSKPDPKARRELANAIPVVDLSGDRSVVVDEIRRASSTLGFFQIVNHGVPIDVLDRLMAAIKAFNEQPAEIKAQHYHREMGRGAAFSTNFDLFQSKAASWRDTLQIKLGTDDYSHVPEICRAEVADWDREIGRLAEELMGMLCEGLGLRKERLKEASCLGAKIMVGHYYPYCPQPDLTVGITSHTDPGVLTVLLQNEVGGLQVKYGEEWVDVEPVPGALVINIGDMLQILSNDEYKSVEHRVLANPSREARISAAIFFNPGLRDNLYGPFPELVTPEKPALYRELQFTDFMQRFFKKELDGKTLVNYYKL